MYTPTTGKSGSCNVCLDSSTMVIARGNFNACARIISITWSQIADHMGVGERAASMCWENIRRKEDCLLYLIRETSKGYMCMYPNAGVEGGVNERKIFLLFSNLLDFVLQILILIQNFNFTNHILNHLIKWRSHILKCERTCSEMQKGCICVVPILQFLFFNF